MDAGAAEPEQRRVDAAAQDVEDVFHAGLAIRGQAPQVRAADQHRPRAQRERLDHVAATPYAAIEQHLDLVADGFGDRRQDANGRRGSVEVIAAVVGNRDRAYSGVDGPAWRRRCG